MGEIKERKPHCGERGFHDHFAVDVGKKDRFIDSLKRYSGQDYCELKQPHIDWLIGRDVTIESMIHPIAMRFAGTEPGGDVLAFEEEDDFVLWQPKTRRLYAEYGNAFALGQDLIWNAGTYAFGACLNIYPDPLAWLQNKRDGIVVLDWSRAFEAMQDAPGITFETEQLALAYKRAKRDRHQPKLFIVEMQGVRHEHR